MFLMYVDESGDSGIPPPHGKSPTTHFFLSGLVVHELDWASANTDLLRFRHWLKSQYGIYLDDELHTTEMFSAQKRLPASLRQLRKYERLAVLRHHLDAIASLHTIRIINVVVDKSRCADSHSVFRKAWYALFQRFENTISRQNFPNRSNRYDRGLVFPDNTTAHVLKSHLEDMRQRNKLLVRQSNGNIQTIDEPIKLIIEDPVCRDSKHSYFVQAADSCAFAFKQSLQPNGFMKKHGGNAYFRLRLEPVLCKHASNQDPLGLGVVRI